jgi:transcriptional regulator with XRE-family HTH domain
MLSDFATACPSSLASDPYRIVDKAYTIGDVTRTEFPGLAPDIERTVSALGAKVATARAERGWSLAQLAQRAGLSPAAVHKIEKSGMTPTIASLMKLAAALGRSVSYFVDEPETPEVNVVRGDERAQVYTSKAGLDLKNISGRYGPFQIAGATAVAEPYADSGPTPMNHPGEELVIVQEGELVFTVDGERYVLGPGDSIHFRTHLPHSWSNPGDTPARAIWLVVRSS